MVMKIIDFLEICKSSPKAKQRKGSTKTSVSQNLLSKCQIATEIN